ncbi:glutamate-5-semialdehyde dehydrogenase [Clostridium sartagoforme]|jgi:glutamate-5-semialdehyde dehydrogenase|uniref:glutamate-5-semialdehyde dehydrogenase n=1 Tax=Clostridium sartagoforme TaxID=84031 RepID=UPI0031DC1056
MLSIYELGRRAKEASYDLSIAETTEKNKALELMAKALIENKKSILEANEIDIKIAKEKGTKEAMIDRLKLNEERIEGMAKGILDIISLEDPVGEVIEMWKRPNGIQIGKRRVPIGVIGIIYEARPNVTSDAAALCVKTGNSVILKGGSDAINSNKAVVKALANAIEESGLPLHSIQLVEDTSREAANDMMRLNEYIDVLIPRGGAGLIKAVVNNATVPVIETGTGNCHVYIDETAEFEMAKNIIINAKVSRPSVCNAAEKLLIHEDLVESYLPKIVEELKSYSVEIRGDKKVLNLIADAKLATEEDWYTEYLDYIIGIKVVSNVNEAISHINKYGSGHSEAIVTNSYKNSQRFLNKVNAAAVYINASTRFTDGGEFGFGAEIGISTQKLHARGPMGLKELTTIKYIIYGNGQIR